MTTQLDLFGEIETAETRRYVDALTCLRDAVPEALQAVVELSWWRERDKRNPAAAGEWAYIVCRAGLRHEREDDWWRGAQLRGEQFGWNRTPADLTTWDELAGLVGDDPRRGAVVAWAESLTEPRWRDLTRPKQLWPQPEQWHPDHIANELKRPGWAERFDAWRTTLRILDDAITALAGDR